MSTCPVDVPPFPDHLELTGTVAFDGDSVGVWLARSASSTDSRWEEGVLWAALLGRHLSNLPKKALVNARRDLGVTVTLVTFAGDTIRPDPLLGATDDCLSIGSEAVRLVKLEEACESGKRCTFQLELSAYSIGSCGASFKVHYRRFGLLRLGVIEASERTLRAVVWLLLSTRPGDAAFREFLAQIVDLSARYWNAGNSAVLGTSSVFVAEQAWIAAGLPARMA